MVNPSFHQHVESIAGSRLFVGPGFVARLSEDDDHLDNEAYPNDLMNSSLQPGQRKLPSALDVQIIAAARDTLTALPQVFVRLEGPVNRSMRTDMLGNYLFNNLPDGVYTVWEYHPQSFLDGIDSRGTPVLGTVSNDGKVSPLDAALVINALNDRIRRMSSDVRGNGQLARPAGHGCGEHPTVVGPAQQVVRRSSIPSGIANFRGRVGSVTRCRYNPGCVEIRNVSSSWRSYRWRVVESGTSNRPLGVCLMFHRRQFLEASAAASLSAGFTATARGYFANETIHVACIGAGGRCRRLMDSLVKVPGVKIAAVCDVWDVHLEMARKLADPGAIASKKYQQLLDRKDIDAVLIAAPDHWHVPMTVDACTAGKDVYVEKPLTHDLSEGAAVVEAQNKHRRIVQVGMQQRSMPHLQKARELIQAGQLGEINKVHLTWNRNQPRQKANQIDIDPASVHWSDFLGNARKQEFDPYRFRNWRWFWDFGGGILTDLMVHWMDVANWFCDLDKPASATTIGDHLITAGIWETPDTIQTLVRYPDRNIQVYFEGTFVNARHGSSIAVMGRDATLYADRGAMIVTPERNSKTPKTELIPGEGPRGADFYDQPNGELLHLTNWIECVRSRATPNAPAEVGVQAVYAAHLGNQAYRSGQIARWT